MELEGGEVAAAAGGAEKEVEKNVDKLHLATVNLLRLARDVGHLLHAGNVAAVAVYIPVQLQCYL